MFENATHHTAGDAFTSTAEQQPAMTRRAAVGCLAGAALAASAGLALDSNPLAGTAQAEEASPALPTATGFTLPEGLTLAADGTLGDVLVVVDMQNAYLEDQCWACTKTSACAENIAALIDGGVCDNVVFTEYLAPENPVGTWATYNEVNADAWLNEIVDALKPYTETYPLYSKSTYSSFGNPDFKSLMARAGRIVITGVMSECCVLATAIDAIDTGTPVVYLTDACSGSSEEYENMATAMMEFASPTHTAIMTCEEYTALRQG